MNYNVAVIIEKDNDGYFAYCPSIQGCYTQGNTYEEVIANIKEVLTFYLKDAELQQKIIKNIDSVSLTTIDVSI